jgi:hypothetical protein
LAVVEDDGLMADVLSGSCGKPCDTVLDTIKAALKIDDPGDKSRVISMWARMKNSRDRVRESASNIRTSSTGYA